MSYVVSTLLYLCVCLSLKQTWRVGVVVLVAGAGACGCGAGSGRGSVRVGGCVWGGWGCRGVGGRGLTGHVWCENMAGRHTRGWRCLGGRSASRWAQLGWGICAHMPVHMCGYVCMFMYPWAPSRGPHALPFNQCTSQQHIGIVDKAGSGCHMLPASSSNGYSAGQQQQRFHLRWL